MSETIIASAPPPVMELSEAIKLGLEKFGLVVGWLPGRDGNLAPGFARSAEQAEKLGFGPSAVYNVARYVRDKAPCAVVAKPCDIRSLTQMIAEDMLKRDELFIIGLRCEGVADMKRAAKEYGFGARVEAVGPDWLVNGEKVDKADLLDARCKKCLRREPLLADVVVGELVTPPSAPPSGSARWPSASAATPAATPARSATARTSASCSRATRTG